MTLSKTERQALDDITSGSLCSGSVRDRAQIAAWRDDGYSVKEVAEMSGTTPPTVRKWVDRFAAEGIGGLVDRPHPGSEPSIQAAVRSRVVALARTTPPDSSGLSRWTSRALADRLRLEGHSVPHNWVATVLREARLKPHRQGTHKAPKDLAFKEKTKAVVGLYLDPPASAVILSVDEKTQIQALDRTQPLLPIAFGHTEQRTADYVRHGTTNLFAALDVTTGEVVGQCKPRRTAEDFLKFMDDVVARYPEKDVYVVLDNLSTHTGKEASEWMERHPTVKFCHTPVGCSWLNQVETWFNIITKQCVRRGTFVSVPHLVRTIQDYIDHWNEHRHPFAWTATADEIIDAVADLERELTAMIDNSGRKYNVITRH